jgi:hypothetical protein
MMRRRIWWDMGAGVEDNQICGGELDEFSHQIDCVLDERRGRMG